MTSPADQNPFGLNRARRALGQFAAGKVVGGVLGIAWLVLTARTLSPADFGSYVSLVALLEITLLTTNLGAFPIAQRYVTEARLPQNIHQLPRLVWLSIGYRLATLLLAAVGLCIWGEGLFAWLGLGSAASTVTLYTIVIVFEGAARFIDLIFESMLQQGLAQAGALLRNSFRLTAVLFLIGSEAVLSTRQVVIAEIVGATVGIASGTWLMFSYIRKTCPKQSHRRQISTTDTITLRRMITFSGPWILAQAITQIYSPDAVKFVIARLLGVVEVASFGLAHSLSGVLQRYLPAQLLLGWIRPLLISRHESGRNGPELVGSANLILKINHFLIAPVIAIVVLEADVIVAIISANKLPAAGELLIGMVTLLVLQAVHVVLTLLATTIEDNRGTLFGTIASVPGIAAGIAMCDEFGALAMVGGLWISECLYCAVASAFLIRKGIAFTVDLVAWMKIALAASLAAICTDWIVPSSPTMFGLLVHGALLTTLYLVFVACLRPFSLRERAHVNRFLPRPWFVF